jgi:hypothetical protein
VSPGVPFEASASVQRSWPPSMPKSFSCRRQTGAAAELAGSAAEAGREAGVASTSASARLAAIGRAAGDVRVGVALATYQRSTLRRPSLVRATSIDGLVRRALPMTTLRASASTRRSATASCCSDSTSSAVRPLPSRRRSPSSVACGTTSCRRGASAAPDQSSCAVVSS